MSQPSLEEFQAWKEHPVTRWVIQACLQAAQAQQEEWTRTSWVQGASDPQLLTELRTRADAYSALDETVYEDWCKIHGQDPIAE